MPIWDEAYAKKVADFIDYKETSKIDHTFGFRLLDHTVAGVAESTPRKSES